MKQVKGKNVTAKQITKQIRNPGKGNPEASTPTAAVGNFYPGLELNFQNAWKRIFDGIELLEWNGEVAGASSDEFKHLVGKFLISVDSHQIYREVNVPENVRDPNNPASERTHHFFLEWSNALARVHHEKGGSGNKAVCEFGQIVNGKLKITDELELEVNQLMEPKSSLISMETTHPGELTESLCSPWQTDYLGCSCFYWASNRPDYVNISDDGMDGHNWINESREVENGKNFYTMRPEKLFTHEGVMQGWEEKYQSVIGERDSPDGKIPQDD